ncbi:sugar ABC transporter ATP-binding protein [Microbacterium protaetiae]|uniref:Sugar ABC transporter ATP-binding protein n=1 Tax=Microbacterium protaetiae TaxID=2509458 RepID=A0A4P6EQC3_9MICO|nr:sugar ABC transporter ATP-binding protein [Microbacterium protaetiae]QAY60118.1 sugar ABC transporter ATP-binding protein [Microbacterium protaetiae]
MNAALQLGAPVLSARHIVKNYGGVRALKGVDFDVYPGTVTTLFGENGAGKSTLMKILSGVEQPSDGTILLDGSEVTFADTNDARDHGISIIHQELSLSPNLSVRDNLYMGRELRRGLAVDYRTQEKRSREVLGELGLKIDPHAKVSELRLGEQQLIEIARALLADSRILIMDEPTSALSANEVEILFNVIEDLTSKGVAIVYISHHLEEALQVTDQAVVLRDGSMTAKAPADEIDLEWIVRHMVGENFDLGAPPSGYEFGPMALDIEGVSVADPKEPDRMLVDQLSLKVQEGEIVCIYGLMGAGRTELLEAVAGRRPLAAGTIRMRKGEITHLSLRDRLASGLGLVPEDRQRDGLVPTLSVGRNISLASVSTFVKGLFVSRAKERTHSDEAISDVRVKTDGRGAPIGSLSGGNQQKVVIGKIVSTGPKVLLLDEPTRGIDVGAKAEVFKLVAQRARTGLAVVYSTSEVGECLSIAHRIIVMSRGRIVAEFDPSVTKEEIMAASGEAVVEA